MSSLLEFRAKYPFKPHDLCWLRGDQDKTWAEVEVISWPFEDGTVDPKVKIKIRLRPDDPATLAETEVSNLVKIPPLVRCLKCSTQWIPRFSIRHAFICTGISGSKQPEVSCPGCGRGYFYYTDLAIKNMHAEGDRHVPCVGWHCDRPLEILK